MVLEGLDFANGVALAADESYVAVAESGACTVVRQWLTGEKAGTRDYLVRELPGYPDNIARGGDGLDLGDTRQPARTRWPRGSASGRTGCAAPPTRIPTRLQPRPKRAASGSRPTTTPAALVHDLDLPPTDYAFVTGVREHDGRVWLGSLQQPAIAFVDV